MVVHRVIVAIFVYCKYNVSYVAVRVDARLRQSALKSANHQGGAQCSDSTTGVRPSTP